MQDYYCYHDFFSVKRAFYPSRFLYIINVQHVTNKVSRQLLQDSHCIFHYHLLISLNHSPIHSQKIRPRTKKSLKISCQFFPSVKYFLYSDYYHYLSNTCKHFQYFYCRFGCSFFFFFFIEDYPNISYPKLP